MEYVQNGKRGTAGALDRDRGCAAIPYDLPVPGYENGTVNTVRLWKAVPTEEFDLGKFSAGLYPEAVAEKTNAENITKVLYRTTPRNRARCCVSASNIFLRQLHCKM